MNYVITAVIVGLIVWAVVVQTQAYSSVEAFVQKCEAAGGFVTTTQDGWITERSECSVTSLND